MKNLLIIGASGFGVDVLEYAKQSLGYMTEFRFKGFLDINKDALSSTPNLPQVICSEDEYIIQKNDVFICSIGNTNIKYKCIEKMKARGANFINLIHRDSNVSPNSIIGIGNIFLHNSTIGSKTNIGNHCLIQVGTVIGHDCVIGDFCRIDCNAVCVGGVKVMDNVTIHTSSVINHDVTIGKNATVGACSFVIRNVKEGATVFGTPAREI